MSRRREIQDEGELVIDLIEGWGVPKAAIKKLRDGSLGKKLDNASNKPHEARSALYHLFTERDSWDDFKDDYEEAMAKYTFWLFIATIVLSFLAICAFQCALWWSAFFVLVGLVFASAAGSCVSVMAKMPAFDASLSGEINAYGRRIRSRIGTGVVASLIGCASLAWLPISIQNQTFADALNACIPHASFTPVKGLIILGLSMLLGFSERTLTSFEQGVFSSALVKRSSKQRGPSLTE